ATRERRAVVRRMTGSAVSGPYQVKASLDGGEAGRVVRRQDGAGPLGRRGLVVVVTGRERECHRRQHRDATPLSCRFHTQALHDDASGFQACTNGPGFFMYKFLIASAAQNASAPTVPVGL